MSEFTSFLTLGFQHISDIQAYDHLLFIVTLCAIYRWSEWKKLLVLITAFTIGHSVTLALSAFSILSIPSDLVELLIPITILLTAVFNILPKNTTQNKERFTWIFSYTLALCFGLIHGMGFASYFKGLFGEMSAVIQPLFAFNLGIELGQIMIVLLFLGIYYTLSKVFNIAHREWNLFVSGAGAGVAITLIINQLVG